MGELLATATTTPPAQRDKEKRRPLEYSCFFFVLCSSSSSSWCWEVLCLFICSLSPFSALSSTSPFTSSTISCFYEQQTGGKERGIFLLRSLPFLFPSSTPSPSIIPVPPGFSCPLLCNLSSPSPALTASVTSSTHQLLLLLNPPVG